MRSCCPWSFLATSAHLRGRRCALVVVGRAAVEGSGQAVEALSWFTRESSGAGVLHAGGWKCAPPYIG